MNNRHDRGCHPGRGAWPGFRLTESPDEIVVLDVGTGALSTITGEATVSNNPAWSPAGTQLLFARRDPTTGMSDIWVVPAIGGTISLVESSTGDDYPAGWRP